MFNKNKTPKPIPVIETVSPQQNDDVQDRNSVLSGWNVSADGFSSRSFAQEQPAATGSVRKGYKLCTKCLSAVPAAEQKCPSCGFIKK